MPAKVSDSLAAHLLSSPWEAHYQDERWAFWSDEISCHVPLSSEWTPFPAPKTNIQSLFTSRKYMQFTPHLSLSWFSLHSSQPNWKTDVYGILNLKTKTTSKAGSLPFCRYRSISPSESPSTLIPLHWPTKTTGSQKECHQTSPSNNNNRYTQTCTAATTIKSMVHPGYMTHLSQLFQHTMSTFSLPTWASAPLKSFLKHENTNVSAPNVPLPNLLATLESARSPL